MTNRTPERDFYAPILRAVSDLGGSARTSAALQRVRTRIELRPTDLELVAKGEERWRNTARFARKDLVELGLLSRQSPHGVWQITERGRAWIANAAAPVHAGDQL
jgi:hypothetical protein